MKIVQNVASIAGVSFSSQRDWTREQESRQGKERAWGEQKMGRSWEGASKFK